MAQIFKALVTAARGTSKGKKYVRYFASQSALSKAVARNPGRIKPFSTAGNVSKKGEQIEQGINKLRKQIKGENNLLKQRMKEFKKLSYSDPTQIPKMSKIKNIEARITKLDKALDKEIGKLPKFDTETKAQTMRRLKKRARGLFN